MFLMQVVTAWVLWRVFYWKCSYAVTLVGAAGAAQWGIEYLTGSTLLSILVVVPSALLIARVLHRENVLRPTHSHGGSGGNSYRLGDEDTGSDSGGEGRPQNR